MKNNYADEPIANVDDVARATGLSIPTIRRRGADPKDDFPAPYRLSPRAVRWKMAEVQDWMNTRPLVIEKEKGARR